MNRHIIRLAAAGLLSGILLLTVSFAADRTAVTPESQDAEDVELVDVSGAILQELRALRAEVQDLSHQIEELRAQVALRPAAPTVATPPAPPTTARVPVPTAGYPAQGKKSAPVTVVEFSDYHCPFCGRHANQTLPELVKNYVDTGKIRYVYVDFAVKHNSPEAAEAAHCAGEQNQFWPMHAYLFAHQSESTPDKLPEMGRALGLDVNRFTQCLADTRYDARIETGRRYGSNAGITGTPSFVIGKTTKDGVISGDLVIGAKSYSYIAGKIDALLKNP
ncbi:MAG: thioredoxin domain-containing protein [Nitrospirota bacterium]|nr:thioredoxin domain-containing protein [Nitrospirota bacterium]